MIFRIIAESASHKVEEQASKMCADMNDKGYEFVSSSMSISGILIYVMMCFKPKKIVEVKSVSKRKV